MSSKNKPNIVVKIPRSIFKKIHEDLDKKHSFAFERMGFIYSSYKKINRQTHLIILNEYTSVDDENYIKDKSVGGRVNSTAIRNAVNKNMRSHKGCFAVHKHLTNGIPSFSSTDLKELPPLPQTFNTIFPKEAHGLLLLSKSDIICLVWLPNLKKAFFASKCVVVGNPMNFSLLNPNSILNERYARQSFLGDESQLIIENTKIGIVGLGGGGSHVVQQLAYLGFKNIVALDSDYVEESNLNRLVGASAKDAKRKTLKAQVAKRLIKSVIPSADAQCFPKKWQESRSLLEDCDIIIGCLDSFMTRRDLEAFCRRHLIPYIDIGMVVNKFREGFSMVGQAICSIPDNPCLQCLGFINEMSLTEEAKRYGDAGNQPQVVWSNGVLASTAIGIVVNLITKWAKNFDTTFYFSYDGNRNLVFEHPRLKVNGRLTCKHYPIIKSGGFEK
jgi:molybdopterin/thiamine biosynthesis adenylyltransferase